MEEIRLLINDQVADLPEGVERILRMQKPGTDLASLDSRAGESSYTLELPFTRQNDRVFSHHRDGQTLDKFAPLVPYTARLYVGGNLFFRGVWQLTSIKGAYIGKLVSDEVDVFTAIGSKTLNELKFAPFAYTGQHGFTDRLALSCAETDVQFPFVTYGNFYQSVLNLDGEEVELPASNKIGETALEVDDYLPSVSFLRTLRQIFADVGWRIRGEILDDAEVRELCMPFTGADMPWNWGELLKYRAEGVPFLNGFLAEDYPWVLQPPAVYNPAGRGRLLDIVGSSFLSNGNRQAYLVRLDGGYRLQCSLTVTELQAGPARLQLRKLEPGQLVTEGTVLHDVAITGPGTYSLDTDTLSLNGLFLETGQVVVPVIEQSPIAGGFRLIYSACNFQVDPREAWPITIDVAKLLPAISQRDFVRGFVTAKNLRFTTDPTTRTLTFHLRERYELPPALALDLSSVCSPDAGEYLPALPARRIVLSWLDDEADALLQTRKGFADYTYQPNRVPVGVEQEEQRLQLPWAPTMQREYVYREPGLLGQAVLVRFPCLASTDALATSLNEVSWSYGFAPRLLVYRGPAPVAEQVLNFAFRAAVAKSYGKADFPASFWFGGSRGLYARHYAGFFEQLLRGHVLRIGAMLSPGTYARLTPAVPLLVHGSLYRLAKIPAFIVGGEGETALELLRVVLAAQGGGQPAASAAEGEWYREEYYPDEFY